MKLIDVSLPLSAALTTYPGNPSFELKPVKRIADGGSSNLSKLSLGTHTGTHVDAPRHFFDEGIGADGLALELLIGRVRVMEVQTRRGARGIGPEHFAGIDLHEELRLFLKTVNSTLWASDGFVKNHAFLTEAGARFLTEQGIKVVGVDYLSIEEFKKAGAPAHRALLGSGTIIIEGLNLTDVDPGVYEMLCLPLRIVGADAAPARVVLRRP